MRKGKKMFIIIEAVLAVMVFLVALAMLWERRGRDLDKISVIVRSSDDTQWAAFKYGLRMAAEDQRVEMFVVSTGAELTVKELQQMIEGEIDNGADAVIVQPVPGTEAEEMLRRMDKRIPVMLVEYAAGGSDSSGLPVSAPDNYAMGKALAEELLKDYAGNVKGKTLGILSEDTDSQAVMDREQGFRDVAEAAGATVSWAVSDGFSGEPSSSVETLPRVDCVTALDDASLTAAGERSLSNALNGALVYGIGHSTEVAYYLDTGAVECLIVPDSFNVGYQSLTESVKCLRNLLYRMQDTTVSHTVIRREDLFTKENQDILFTMSQ